MAKGDGLRRIGMAETPGFVETDERIVIAHLFKMLHATREPIFGMNQLPLRSIAE